MAYDQIGRLMIVVGAVIVALGLILFLLGRVIPLGKLPGDFTFTSGSFTCMVPLASMLLLSIILTVVLNIVLRLFNR
jgi:hypothetical protein